MVSTINAQKVAGQINSSNKDFKFIDWSADKADGGWVEIIINDKVYTATVSATGKYSFEMPNGWNEGLNVVQIVSVDPAGSRSTPSLFILNIDTQAPVAPKIMRVIDNDSADHYLTPGDVIKDKTPLLSGSAEPNSIVKIYDGAILLSSVTANGMGVWEYEATLANGSHSITVTATDATNNTSVASGAFVINVSNVIKVLSNEDTSDIASIETQTPDATTFDVGDARIPQRVGKDVLSFIDQPIGSPKDAGNLVQITLDGIVYTTRVTADGKYTWISPQLDDGLHVVQIRSLDAALNWSPATQIIYKIEAAAPEKPIIMSALDDVGGVSNLSPGEFTNDNTPTFSGIAQPNTLVTFYDGGAQIIGTVMANSDGTWTFTPTTGLTEGVHFISAEYIDYHKRTSLKSDAFKLEVDTITPATPTIERVQDDAGRVTDDLISGDKTDDTTPTFSGSARLGSIVQIWNGTTLLGTATVSDLGKWSFTPTSALPDGPYHIHVDAISKGGNTSSPSPVFDLIIDSTLAVPVEIGDVFADNVAGVTSLIPDHGVTNDSTPVVTGVGNNGDVVYLYVDGKPGAVGSATVVGGKWSITPTPALTEGDHVLTVKAFDPVAQKWAPESQPRDIEIDLTAPDQPDPVTVIDDQGLITGPIGSGGITDDKRPEFKGGGADEGDTVEVIVRDDKGNPVYVGSQIVGPGGDWSITPPTDLVDGEYEIVVVVTDPAGNKSDESTPVKIIIDTDKPLPVQNLELTDDVGTVTGPIKDGMTTDDTKPTFSGDGVNGTKVAIIIGGNEVARVDVVGGKWTYTPATALAEGAYAISAKPYSASGVPGDTTPPINFIVDTTAPTSGTFDGVWYNAGQFGPLPEAEVDYSKPTNDNTLSMRGTGGENGNIVYIYGSAGKGELLGTTIVQNGKWEYTTDPLAERSVKETGDWYDFHVVFEDAAGNKLDLSTTHRVEVDTTPPPPPPIPGINSVFELNALSEDEVSNLMSMSLNDILAQGEGSMFIENGKSQLLVNGKEGDVLNIADILPEGAETASWQQAAGTVTVAGIQYNVYENTTANAELLVQQGIETQH